jgi:hypothetical protein
MPTISANGSTALRRRTPANLSARNMDGQPTANTIVLKIVTRYRRFSRGEVNVRFGSLADIEIVITHVCFASKSAHVHNQNECLLSARSGYDA